MGVCGRLPGYQGSISYRTIENLLRPAANAQITIYREGTLTPAAIYADEFGLVVKGNPFVVDANGWAEFYLGRDDCHFDMLVEPAAGEFAPFARTNLGAPIANEPVEYHSDDFSSIAVAIATIPDGSTLVIVDDATVGGLTIAGRSDLEIVGLHRGVTLTLADGANAVLFNADNSLRCSLRRLRLDGNAANQAVDSARVGLSLSASSRFVGEDLEITNCRSDGLVINAATDLTLSRVRSYSNEGHGFSHGGGPRGNRVLLDRCIAELNGDDTIVAPGYPRLEGFDFEPPPDNLTLRDCHATLNQGSGCLVGSEVVPATYRNIAILNLHTEGNATAFVPGDDRGGLIIGISHSGVTIDGVLIEGGRFTNELEAGIELGGRADGLGSVRRFRILGPLVDRNRRHGIRIAQACSDGAIEGAQAINNDQSGAVGMFGISVQGQPAGPCRRIAIRGCISGDDQGVATQQNGILLGSDTHDCNISDSTTYGNTVSSITYANSTNAIVHDNHEL